MKKIIKLKLKILAKLILKKYKPEIIGITGSVGKTSAKEAIYAVLQNKYHVRRSLKNYNNEFGLPLAIIGCDSPGRNILGWIKVFVQAVKLILGNEKDFPKILILEMGVDRPGDMDYLTKIAKCNVGVVTFIGSSHLEYFGSLKGTQKEKGKLIQKLKRGGWSILNYDNELSRQLSEKSKTKVLTYGLSEGANVRAQEIIVSFKSETKINNLRGISYKLSYAGSFVPVLLPKVIGYNSVYASLAAAAVGIAHGMNLIEIAEALKSFESPQGRMNLIPGIKRTLIIDDTYNASPQSCASALEIISKIEGGQGKKYAVLGDMLELGSYSEQGHQEVGEKVYRSGIDKLITVGERSRDIIRGAKKAGMSEDDMFNFSKAEEAGLFVQDRIKKGDLIFIKGSQGMRMEKIVKEIMADPLKAGELLVRQGKEWEKK